MTALGLAGSAVVIVLWIGATAALVRGMGSVRAKLATLALCAAAGFAGCWGPEVHRSSETRFSEQALGPPAEMVRQGFRTPVVRGSRTVAVDGTGDVLRATTALSIQVPITILAVLGWALWWRWRRGRGWALLLPLLLVGCGEGELGERAERRVIEVAWDTVLVAESLPEDTVFFAVTRVAADSLGIRVLDAPGHRIAMVSWEGEVLWYAGSRGSGPGELLHPREIAVDGEGGTWILDVATHRIAGFDAGGGRIGEVPLYELDFVPHEFTVGGAGERYFVVKRDEGIRPVELDRTGRARFGERTVFPGSAGAPSLALQGLVQAEPGTDRWVFALAMGDGFRLFEGVEPRTPIIPYAEPIPPPTVEVRVEGDVASGNYSRSQRVVDHTFAARSGAVVGGRVVLLFGGRTERRNRLLDVYDAEDGAYRGSLELPVGGMISVWDDLLVLGRNAPHPKVLVLRPSRWP